ncbi:hypothetical protein EW093_10530 [Thiospirochaeta perfilievii]|uniref:branched-chain-amino-acid transaminase n=1 Tax=Thiospirochaeta perfilievii TaxID=252967 RepID=A0A5C1QCR3_9SPIO|nr:aminotransferase class IV [Thiospirochaeta perfilievii]QEN05128.1 hypothetical protein EW093_10530 [Thiospirochaeta perfilievii]
MINIYEVMATMDNLPIFFFQHMERLHRSINNYIQLDYEKMLDIVKPLILSKLPESKGKNIKITFNLESSIFTIDLVQSRTPNKDSYIKGGTLGIVDLERDTPLIKRENLELRSISDKICSENGFYDILLENKIGGITEGSRSNFLCIDKDGRVITSPLSSSLQGITREMIFLVCREEGIPVIERVITKNSLKEFDSLIITGTSPGILPIRSCENIQFNIANPTVSKLQKGYINKQNIDLTIAKDYFNL